jgi:protein-S-isoprenylcysteine O-methyltransferase Ste14
LFDHLVYALLWIGFGVGHSLLAHPPVQRKLARRLGPATRLAYNLFALVHLAVVWGIGRWLAAGAEPFARPDALIAVQWTMVLAGTVLMVAGLREYDLGRFAGTWHLRHRVAPTEEPAEPLVTGGLHRYMRHPLYTAGFLILWGLVDGPFALATAAWASAYLVIGTWFEERKLLRLYGAAYRAYRRRVPAYVPWKGAAGG